MSSTEFEYHEYRTKHALRIDRAIQARRIYGKFNIPYSNAPNRSDVDDYDTVGVRKPEPRGKQEPEPKPTEKRGEYVPNVSERKRLVKIFHKLRPIDQYKDLQTTKNVVKTDKQLQAWKANAKNGDIRNIDTAPLELFKARAEVARKHVGDVPVTYNPRLSRAYGQYRWYRGTPEHKGGIVVRKGLEPFFSNEVLSHEVGHAYDRNVIGKIGYVGSVSFNHKIRLDKDNYVIKNDHNRKVIADVIGVTQKRLLLPYNPDKSTIRFHRYRMSNQELFANWFSGLLNRKNTVKRYSKGYYNIFKSRNKPLIKALKASDREVLMPLIKVPKGFKGF